MPTRRPQPLEPHRRPRLQKSSEVAASLIDVQIQRGRELAEGMDPMRNPGLVMNRTVDDIENDVRRWHAFSGELLGGIFDTDEVAHSYDWTGVSLGGSSLDGPDVILRRLRQSVIDRISNLEGVKERVEAGLYERAPDVAGDDRRNAASGATSRPASGGSPVINIYDSTVGTLNTGEVLGNIHSRVSGVTGSPSADAFRKGIDALSEVVAAAEDLPNTKRTEALDCIEVIAESAAQPATSRRVGVVRSVIASLPETLALSSRALDAWDKYGGAIRAHLGL
jgi:hypothetical protein